MKKVLIAGLVLILLLVGCSQTAEPWEPVAELPLGGSSQAAEPWEPVAELPYDEHVGSLVQYKNFARGPYEFYTGETYTLSLSWTGEEPMTLSFTGENGHQEEILIKNGVPVTLTVPEDGLYSLHTPLNNSDITDLEFSIAS